MKSVMLSVQTFWCGKIASKEKTAEIRKSKPSLSEPFKVYIYCTKDSKHRFWRSRTYSYVDEKRHNYYDRCGNGMVIGEFVCGGIISLGNVATEPWEFLQGDGHEFRKRVVTQCARLSEIMLKDYANGRPCYAWEIEDVLIYDEPKLLSEFGLYRAPQSWCYVKEVA